jgi:hypothetical protein
MKTKFLNLSLLAIIFSTFISCSKKGDAGPTEPGPDITLPTSGLLCTRTNYLRPGGYDTVKYRTSTLGRNMFGYIKGTEQNGERILLTTNGDNTVSVKLEKPLITGGLEYNYFLVKVNSSPSSSIFPFNAYLFNWSQTNTPESKFIIARSASDKLKFTLESKAFPGNYLGTGRWKNSNADNDDNLIVGSTKQEFFFKAD